MLGNRKTLSYFCVFVVICFALPLSSCVYDSEFAYVNDQIISLNKRVKTLEETLGTGLERDLDTRLESVHSNQAGLSTEIDELREEVQKLSGRVENNEHVIKRTVERDLTDQDTVKAAVSDMAEQVTALETAVKRQQDYLGLEPASSLGKPGKGKVKAPPSEPGENTPVTAKVEPVSVEVALYDRALALFREGRFEDAMDGFSDFLKRYPSSDRADNAQFWIGESYMALNQYEKAILAYQEVIKKYPKGNKLPNALLRQAAAFEEINDKTSSRLLLKKLIKDHPDSSEAEIARKKLAALE
ncbi:MAG: tol-pal system protein YbgF [Deltaproteobacteria bacterium]